MIKREEIEQKILNKLNDLLNVDYDKIANWGFNAIKNLSQAYKYIREIEMYDFSDDMEEFINNNGYCEENCEQIFKSEEIKDEK